jgi:hypothetical protein
MLLVNHLLDLSQIETGQEPLHTDLLELKPLCERSFELAQQNIANSDAVQLHLDVPSHLNTFTGDGRHLRQTLLNLFAYVLRFVPATAQLQLQIKTCPGWICWQLNAPGLMIPPELQPQVLERLVQIEHPRDRCFPKNGLGLLLTRRLAQLQGGELAFVAWPDQDCEFSLWLPHPPQPENVSELKLALVTETDVAVQQQLLPLLQQHHYLPVLARSATELHSKARLLKPAVIFLNLNVGGSATLTHLKTDVHTQKFPVVVLGGDPQITLPEEAQAGLMLPLNPLALDQVLDHLRTQPTPSPRLLNLPTLSIAQATLRPASPLQPILENPASLTVLRLGHSIGCPLPQCRILEADDLEQAELLARIWQPDILLWDWLNPNPTPDLRALSRHPHLANLPLVTVDLATTRAATQFPHLQIFPCLVAETLTSTSIEQVAATLWQVVQVAAHAARPPMF